MRTNVALVALLLIGCKKDGDDTDGGYVPDLYCPGDPVAACDDADGPLMAGAASASLMPECWEQWDDVDADHEFHASADTFEDCGCDRLCADDEGWPGADEGEGDGALQTVWIAGSQSARAMRGARPADLGLRGEGDGLYTQVVVLRQGDVTLAIVGADVFGLGNDDVRRIRQEVADRGLDVDHVVFQSSHSHASADTLGLWGPTVTKTGYVDSYVALVRTRTVDAVAEALAALEPVELVVGQVRPSEYDAEKGVTNVVGDTRDPWVIEDFLGAAAFVAADGRTVATLVNWGNHPETSAFDFTWMSADFVHALRKTVEDGVTWDAYSRPGRGGVAVFLNGPQGGMMTSLHIDITDPDGNTWSEDSFEKADANGMLVGEMALDALEAGERVADPKLSFRVKDLYLPVDNIGLQAFAMIGIVPRETFLWDPEEDITTDNVPHVRSEIDVVDIGPLQLMTMPGELLPELAIGGYDGSQIHTPGQALLDPDQPNPPDVASAPGAPYLKDRMTGEYRWVLALGNDEVGYIIPEYNFVTHPTSPYLLEAEGDHYEETVSLGPKTAGLLDAEAKALLEWAP